MAVMNPCCCRLQLGVTIIAIINIILCVLLVILQFLSVLLVLGVTVIAATDSNENRIGHEKDPLKGMSNATIAGVGIFLVIVTVIVLLVYIADLIASVYLLIGAKTRNMYKCRIWFALSLFLMAIYLLSKVSKIAKGIFGSAPPKEQATGGIGQDIIEMIVVTLITGYQLWVVYAFMEELKQDAAHGRPRGVESGGVYYAPKDNTTGDNPPPYGQAVGYTPYPSAGFATQPMNPGMYPSVPPSEDNIPYKKTTTNY